MYGQFIYLRPACLQYATIFACGFKDRSDTCVMTLTYFDIVTRAHALLAPRPIRWNTLQRLSKNGYIYFLCHFLGSFVSCLAFYTFTICQCCHSFFSHDFIDMIESVYVRCHSYRLVFTFVCQCVLTNIK